MAWAVFKAIYDNEDATAKTVNRTFTLPDIGHNQAYLPYFIQAAVSSQSAALAEITTSVIERCQFGIGKDPSYTSIDSNELLCDARDPGYVSGFRFYRSGVWDQVIVRDDPFRDQNIYIRSRIDKANASDLLRVTFKLYYEVIDIDFFQARVLDVSGIYFA